jgi:WD40 repeat protein
MRDCTQRLVATMIILVVLAGCQTTEFTPTAVPESPTEAVAPATVTPAAATPTLAAPTDTPAPPTSSLQAPLGRPATLDGKLSPEEWDGAHVEELAGGGELLFMYSDGYLYLGIRSRALGYGSVCVSQDDQVSVLHSSAALGSAAYERDAEGWHRTRQFSWCCRLSADTEERDALLRQEGWAASIGYLGVQNEMEYQIAMDEGSLILAVVYQEGQTQASALWWPQHLDDDCLGMVSLAGDPLERHDFSPEEWIIVTAPGEVAVPDGPVDTWIRTYEGEPRSTALDALLTPDGGYLLVGATNYSHQNTSREDIHLMKTDASGVMIWERSYGGEDFDRGYDIIPTANGSFVILGETRSFGAGARDLYLIQVDSEGNKIWARTFGGPDMEEAGAIQQTADGGYILTGRTASYGAGGGDVFLIRTDELGHPLWSQTYGGEHSDNGCAMQETPEGDFLILAEILHGETEYTQQNPDIYLLKVDSAGNEIWSQTWAEEDAHGGYVLLPLDNGDYLITGLYAATPSPAAIDPLFLQIDGEGNIIWNRTIGDEHATDYGIDVIQTSDGGFVLTGMSSRRGQGSIPLIKTNRQGEVVWRQDLIEGRGNKAGMKVLQAPDGGFVLVGGTDEGGRGFRTVLIKTNEAGKVVENDPPTPIPADRAGDLIAFVSDRDGNGEIYVMDVEGGDPQRLTHNTRWDGIPSWSPDGTQIAFYSYLSRSRWAIQVMDADGGNLRQLTDNDACDSGPSWSPDGTRIAFTSGCEGMSRDVYVMNADGSDQQLLTQTDADDFGAAWSPDSSRIAFVSNRDGNEEIYLMDADGSAQQRLTYDDASAYAPDWSPDGTQIVFISDRDGDFEIYVMDVDGGNLRQLTHDDADDWFPVWSPDGTQIIFCSRRDGGDFDIYLMDTGGTLLRRLTDNPAEDFNATWQPVRVH